MSTFVNDTLTFASTQSDKTLKRLEVFLRPTEKNEFFRFRLLWFKNPENKRKTPWIERSIHSVWVDGENGKRQVDEIVCPATKHVAETWSGNAYDDCPICKFGNMNYVAYRDSNYKDKVAGQNGKIFKRKYDLVVPVYIITDPAYSANAGKIRVFRINDKEVGEKFKKLVIEKSSSGSAIFNGGNALDFIIRMDSVEHVLNEGTEKEFHYKKNEIVQMGFSKSPYEIPAITKEMIDEFPFDDVYYASPTMADLKEFHKKHCLHAKTDDIDLDGLDTVASAPSASAAPKEPAKEEPPKPTANVVSKDGDLSDLEDIGGLIEDTPPKPKNDAGKAPEAQSGDIDVDEFLADLDI